MRSEKSSGNIFADLKIDNPEEELAKARRMAKLRDAMNGHGSVEHHLSRNRADGNVDCSDDPLMLKLRDVINAHGSWSGTLSKDALSGSYIVTLRDYGPNLTHYGESWHNYAHAIDNIEPAPYGYALRADFFDIPTEEKGVIWDWINTLNHKQKCMICTLLSVEFERGRIAQELVSKP